MALSMHACDIQARCLQSDKLEFKCDYIVHNMAAWRFSGKVFLTFVAMLAFLPMVRSMQSAAVEEHLLSGMFEELQTADSKPLGFYAAAFHLRLSLRARREAMVWLIIIAMVASFVSKPPTIDHCLPTALGLSILASADRLWPHFLLSPASYAELQGKIGSWDAPQASTTETCRGLAGVALMLLLSFHFDEVMELTSPVLEAWGSGRGHEPLQRLTFLLAVRASCCILCRRSGLSSAGGKTIRKTRTVTWSRVCFTSW